MIRKKMKDYKMTCEVPEDLRNEWLAYLVRRGCTIIGARAGIKKATSAVLVKALREELEKEI
jgi:hypothetical protein